MAGIFISYRRQDSEGSAGRLLHTLRQHFGADRVFMDVTGIEPGADFRAEIDSWIKRCDVFIAVIGKQWLAIQKQRINDPRDYVRIETAGALQRKIPLIPVLVEGAALPGPDGLPEDLREISYRNAKELRHTSWDDDCAALIRVLEKYVTGRADASPALQQRSESNRLPTEQKTGRLPRGNWFKLLAGALTAGVIGFAGYFAYTTMTVMVPRVEGHLQVDTASEVLRMTGLGVTVTRERTAAAPEGQVLRQTPPGLTRVSRGTLVELTVAAAPQLAVPDLAGLSRDEAEARLIKIGLTANIRTRESDAAAPGKVIEHTPKAATQVEPGAAVEVIVGVSPQVDVPELLGHSLDAVRRVLAARGLKVGPVDTVVDANAKPGSVVGQNPLPGTSVVRGSVVAVNLAAESEKPVPPTQAIVPAVIRRDSKTAAEMLSRVGLRASFTRREVSSRDLASIVLEQNPRWDTPVASGSTVVLTVGSYRDPKSDRDQPAQVPDVVGMDLKSGWLAMEKAGLKPKRNPVQSREAAAYTILKQSLPSGRRVDPQTVVELVFVAPPPKSSY